MKKRCCLAGLLSVFCIFSSYAVTWTFGSSMPSWTPSYTTSSLNTTKSFTVKRDSGTGTAYFYLLVSGAQYGSSAVGERRVYLNGDENNSSLHILLRPSSGTSEIGTDNISGTTNISGTMYSGTKSKTVYFKIVTGAGAIPSGVYTNVFTFQLYTGSTASGGGTALPVFGTLTLTVTVFSTKTFSIQINPDTVNFGSALLAGYSYSANTTMTVTAAGNFRITVLSLHSGHLYLSEEEQIAYSLYFNNSSTATDLSDGLTILLSSSQSVTNHDYPLRFVTEVIDFIEPGLYTDSLLFTFTTN